MCLHSHAYVQPRPLCGTTPITDFASVVTAITVAAIRGQDGYSLSKIDSNKHLQENSTNPKEQQAALGVPIQLVWITVYSQNPPSGVRGQITQSTKAY